MEGGAPRGDNLTVRMTRHASRRRQRGQAAVETAIVMPLFIFIMLGLLQLGLMHQAKLMTKYAAFKAVRAGSLNRGDPQAMQYAAIAALMPVITQKNPMSGGGGARVGQEQYGLFQVASASKYVKAFDTVSKGASSSSDKLVEVTICHPKKSDAKSSTDFDDPDSNPLGGNNDWRPFEHTKLAIQVTLYYRLFIPFANAFVWYAAYGNESADQIRTMKQVLRSKTETTASKSRKARDGGGWTLETLKSEADKGNYIMPIRASYAMRMMSNFAESNPLPSTNECRVAWPKKGKN